MEALALGALSAFWLGILTSISPCPLATNIAAISFISRNVTSARWVILSGVLYTLGRSLTYLVLGTFLVSSLLSVPLVSHVLQKYMNTILGPLLILVGMFLLELVSVNAGNVGISDKIGKRMGAWSVWGALVLGSLFALSFCPVSAALFFGSLVPLAVKVQSRVVLPALYGVGTGLPVLGFAVLITFSTQTVGRMFEKVTCVEKWARWVTGAIFVGVGIYYSLVFIFEVIH